MNTSTEASNVEEGCEVTVWLRVAISCTGCVSFEIDFEIGDCKVVDVVMISKLIEACNDARVVLDIFINSDV